MATGKKKPDSASKAGEGNSRPGGRPSSYSDKLSEEICDRIANGESLVQICRDGHMPHRRTVLRWMEADSSFATRCARAREVHADHAQDKMLDIEIGVLDGQIDPTAARVVLSSMQWRASKLAPKKYGDVSKIEHSGPNGAAIQMQATVLDAGSMSPEERDVLRALLQSAKAKKEGA